LVAKPLNLRAEATRIAKRHKIPVHVFHALISAESGWQQGARSGVGAIGLAQLMPKTAAGLGVDPTDPIQNLEGGARYLRQQLDRFGDLRTALAAYNAGPGNVERYGGIPPFAETQRYVQKIMATPRASAPNTPAAPMKPRMKRLNTPAPVADPGMFGGAVGQTAFKNLGRIAMGESATDTLGDLVDATKIPDVPVPAPVAAVSAPVRGAEPVALPPTRPGKAVPLKAGGGWGGSEALARSLAGIGIGHGLTATSEKRAKRLTASGNLSDHSHESKDAYAFDLSNGSKPTPEMDRAAIDIARRLGVRYDGKGPLELTKVVNGYRIQVLYRTNTGGNHYNHLHLGVRRYGG
jgi:hypothetical protein